MKDDSSQAWEHHGSVTSSTDPFASTLLPFFFTLGSPSMLLRIESPQKQSGNCWVGHFPEPTSPSSSPYSSGCGRGTCGPGCHGLHWDRHCSCLHSSQDDVCCSNCQWRWSCSRKPGSHTPISRGPWTLHINKCHPRGCWGSCWSLALSLGDDTSISSTQSLYRLRRR